MAWGERKEIPNTAPAYSRRRELPETLQAHNRTAFRPPSHNVTQLDGSPLSSRSEAGPEEAAERRNQPPRLSAGQGLPEARPGGREGSPSPSVRGRGAPEPPGPTPLPPPSPAPQRLAPGRRGERKRVSPLSYSGSRVVPAVEAQTRSEPGLDRSHPYVAEERRGGRSAAAAGPARCVRMRTRATGPPRATAHMRRAGRRGRRHAGRGRGRFW